MADAHGNDPDRTLTQSPKQRRELTGTPRYCVYCGHEIGREPFCPGPDCDGKPNLYRDVPGPSESRVPSTRPERRRRPVHLPRPNAAAPGADDAGQDEGAGRRTVAVESEPVAMLRGRGAPGANSDQYRLYEGPNEVGSADDADIRLPHDTISVHHARIECSRDTAVAGWIITVFDRDSRNGTFVDENRVDSPRRVADGDTVRFADVEFTLSLLRAET